jgi:hypothetical protein
MVTGKWNDINKFKTPTLRVLEDLRNRSTATVAFDTRKGDRHDDALEYRTAARREPLLYDARSNAAASRGAEWATCGFSSR